MLSLAIINKNIASSFLSRY